MSRTQNEATLCALLVDDVYGELSSRIFTVLLRKGRLSTGTLIQQSGIHPEVLKKGLVVLIQQNLIYYYDEPIKGITYYEANWDAAFALARSGRILSHVHGRFGEDAKDVVQNLLLLGHTKVEDLIEAYAQKSALLRKSAPKTNGHTNGVGEDVEMTNGHGTNGVAEDAKMTNGDVHKTGLTYAQLDRILRQLLEAGYIQPVTAALFKSPADTYAEVEFEALRAIGGERGTKTSKKALELKNTISDRLRELRKNNNKWKPILKGNNKRPRDDDDVGGSDKRRKMANGQSVKGEFHALENYNITVDPNMIVRVNHEKLAVALRNKHLVELAERYIGTTTALVYSALLDLMEDQVPRCRRDPLMDDEDSDEYKYTPISTIQIYDYLPDSIDMAQGIAKAHVVKDEPDSNKVAHKKNGHKINGDQDSDSDDSPFRPLTPAKSSKVRSEAVVVDKRSRMEQIRQHLLLLTKDKRNFATRVGGGDRTSWTVEYEPLGEVMRNVELDAVVYHKFQEKGTRFVRMLREKGKLDEKAISNISLSKITEARQLLIEMQMAGFVDIQEIPKDTKERAANKALFFWFFDDERVTKLVLDNIYKAMCRVMQRLDVERYRDKDAIAAAERTDVNGDLDKMNTDAVAKLKAFYKKEELLSGLMAKLDKTAAVFREY